MAKDFNTTGLCIPNLHYMVNVDNKIDKILKFIEKRKYFTINRPRQLGKTTILNELDNRLKDEYLIISISFEGIGDVVFENEKKYNSPWNIAVDFDVDMSFSPEEIKTMLVDYARDYDFNMDTKALSERIYFFTSEYPYLVIRICQRIDEKIYGVCKANTY